MKGILPLVWFSLPLYPLLALNNLSTGDPPTAYIQWLDSPSEAMSNPDGGSSMAFSPYMGGATTLLSAPPSKDFYLGVMCNRLNGYTVSLTAMNEASSTTAKMTSSSGRVMTYTCSLSRVSGTFAAGATTTISLDLTGNTPSATASFATTGDLPLTTQAPNVWRLSATLPSVSGVNDGLIVAGSYSGGVTATISVR